MGFNLYGCPNTKDTNVITLENKIYLGLWITKLNFDNYTKSVFRIDLEINKNSEISYIKNELKVLEFYINWIENVFEFRKISKYDIETYKTEIEKNDIIFNQSRLLNFIDDFKSNKRDIKLIHKTQNVGISINNTNEIERVYLLCLMYLDILYIKDFLQSKLLIFEPIPKQPEAVKPDEVYKTQNLFKVGLLFATGEMNKYFIINNLNEIVLNNGLSPLKIANELGNPSFEKIILASKNNYKEGENKVKNLFNNLDMMNKIINHCKAKKIEIDPYFISRLPIE